MKTKRNGWLVPNKAGWRPREEFLRRLCKKFPTIRIAYAAEVKQWVVLQEVSWGDVQLLFSAGPRFGEGWLERKLLSCRVRPSNVEALIGSLEANEAMQEITAEIAARSKIEEGHDMLSSGLAKGSRIALPRRIYESDDQ